jgi:hypothetical protein
VNPPRSLTVPPFAGIHEKLKRADENILNLQSEVSFFFEKCEYPVMPKIYSQEHAKAIQYFKQLAIPLRFGVLAGEIDHHLRSCLDHIIWEFSAESYRRSDRRWIEFPVFKERPLQEKDIARYERKIKGVSNVRVLKLIDELQPYKRTYPVTDFLWLIHEMDIIDKHRELVITHATGHMEGPWPLMREVRAHLTRNLPMPTELKRKFDEQGQITPQISFKDLIGWEAQPIVLVLSQLTDYVRHVVSKFAIEF